MAKVQQHKDPEILQSELAGLLPGHVRVVGIDLGTNCGIAWVDFDPRQPILWDKFQMYGGQLDLSLGPYDTGPVRHIRLKQFMSVIHPSFIGFEDVKNTPTVAGFAGKKLGMIMARVATSAELLGGFKIILCTWAEERKIPCQGYAIGTIKKYATGKGNAGKPAMIEAANKRFGCDLDPEGFESSGTDNIADAMHVCAMTVEGYAKGLV
jgi:hypothetical protein